MLNERSQIESNAITRDQTFVKSRYEARRKFFEDLEHRDSLAVDSVALSRAKTTGANNEENKSIFEQNFTVSPNEKPRAHLVKLFDVSLINASTKKYIENMNDETRSSNNVAMHSVAWANIAQPSFVKRVNIEETRPSLHNIMSCVNGDNQTEEQIGYHERAKSSTIKTMVSVKTKSSTICEDKSNLTIGTNNEHQHALTTTITLFYFRMYTAYTEKRRWRK